MKENCVIYGIKYDKKTKKLVGTLFIPEPRELLTDIPYKEIYNRVKQQRLVVKDDGIVRDCLYQIIEDHLLFKAKDMPKNARR